VAFGVPDVAAAAPFLAGALGGREHGAGPGPGFRWYQWRFAEDAVIELIEPAGPPGGFLHRFLASRGPGVHHVTFKVPDLVRAARRAEERGYRIVGFDDRDPGWKEAFLHPREAQGVVVQLAESDPAAEGEGPPPLPFPPAPAAARAEPAGIAALVLAARSAERARGQWEELLGGRTRAADGRLELAWRGSPIRLVVEIDPRREEGPQRMVVSGAPGAALPEGPQPVLGLPFARL